MTAGQRTFALIATAFLGGTATVLVLSKAGALEGPFLLVVATLSLAGLAGVQVLASRSRKSNIKGDAPIHDRDPGDDH